MSSFGTVVRGVKMPIIKQGDDIVNIIVDNIINAAKEENLYFKDNDVIGITESVIARAEGNYVTVDDVANDIKKIFNNTDKISVLWPIYSRNRFSLILKAIARAANKTVVIQLNKGKDEVGNDQFNPFTGVDIVEFYKNIVKSEGKDVEFYFSDDATNLFDSEENIIDARFHDFYQNLPDFFPLNVITLKDICFEKSNDHGYNDQWGLLGSNKMGDELLKLFPKRSTCDKIINSIKQKIDTMFNVNINVMVYADGAFKDPVCGIWEFADPEVSPAYTKGLEGKPNEIKLKYLADDKYKDLTGNELEESIKKEIIEHNENLVGKMISQGTTPRRYTDLIGSLMDLCSGSGSKGTPVVWVQNYFDTYAD